MSEIRTGAVLNYLLLILQIGIPLVLTPMMMEHMGAAEFGVYMLAGSIMTRLYLSDLGRTTTTRFLSEYHSKGDTAGAARFLGTISMLYGLVGILLLALGLAIYPWLGHIFSQFDGEELRLYRILYLMLIINAAVMFPARSLAGVADSQQKFIIPTLITMSTAVINAIGTVILLKSGLRSVALMSLTISTGIISLLLNVGYCFLALRARITLKGSSRALCRSIIVFSLWMFLNQLINILNAGTGNYLVAITRGATPASIYTNGLQIYAHYFVLAGILTTLFLPRVVRLVTRGASATMQTNAMIRLGRIQLMLLGYFLLILVFFGQEFFELWVGHIPGSNPQLSWFIMVALIVPQTFALVQSLGWQITQARDALRQRVLITGFNSLLFIIVSYFVCEYWGLYAQAIWAAISILIQLVMINLLHYRRLGLEIGRFYSETFRGAWLCALLLVGICLIINSAIPSRSWGWLSIKIVLLLTFYLPIIGKLYVTRHERRFLWSR